MLAWAPSVECTKSCHASSRSWRIGYEGSTRTVERDLYDLCRRPCSNSIGCSDVSVRVGNQPQLEFYVPEPSDSKLESKVDHKGRDGERCSVLKGLGNQIGEYVRNHAKTLGVPKAAVLTEPWLSGSRSSTESQLTGDVGRAQKTSTNQLHYNSLDSFESFNCLQRSPSITSRHQGVTPHAECEREVEAPTTAEQVSDPINRTPSLKNRPHLAERESSAPRNLLGKGLENYESTQRSGRGSRLERSENVELVSSGPTYSREHAVECSRNIRVGQSLQDVSCLQALHDKSKETTAESGNLGHQKLQHSEVLALELEDRRRTAIYPTRVLTEPASSGGIRDALGIESLPQCSGSDKLEQGSIRALVRRGLKSLQTRRESERDVEDVLARLGRRYGERLGNLGETGSGKTNPENAGDIQAGRKSKCAVTAGIHSIPERIGQTAEGLIVREVAEVSENHSTGERGTADSYPTKEGIGGTAEGFTIRERTGASPSEGSKIPERIGAASEREAAGKVPEKGKGEKLHSREEGHQRQNESSEERRLRARVDGSSAGASLGGDETEGPKVVRPARPSGGKDRHSKVNTAKGPRDRRVRLSVPTAVQFYDVQDRLGFDQPSKAVEWLIHKAKDAIDELGRVPADGKEGSRVCGSDISHQDPNPSSYNAAVSGLVSGSSSCTPASSFREPSGNPYADQLSYFMDPSTVTQGMFANLQPNQGNFAGPTFDLARIDLASGSIEGGVSSESTGSPLARAESRTKARERARERTKKGPGRDGTQGQVTGGGSPSSSQSPTFHSNPTFSSFNASNPLQGSVHSLSFQPPLLSGAYENPYSRTMQGSHQTGPFQNLGMHNSPLDSQFKGQIQSPHHNSFLLQPQGSSQNSSQTMNSLQQPHLQVMQVNAQGALHLGSTFNPGPCSSSFAGGSTSSSHYSSVSTVPLSQSVPQLSILGMSPSSLGPHYPTGSPTPIPPGFSPGPPASAFLAHSLSISQSSNQSQQQQLQGDSRVQRPLLSFSAATSGSAQQAGSSSSRGSTHPYYLGTPLSTLMGCLQSTPSERLNTSSFAPRSSLDYDHVQRPRSMVSPPAVGLVNPYQPSSSQIPARIQGLDDMEELEEELNSETPSSPHH